MIGIIIQARTSSTRLPNKVLLPFNNHKGILEILVEILKNNFSCPIIIATSKNKKDNSIEDLAKKKQVYCFRGDEHNVLKRFQDASLFFGLSKFIRICSDNPFLNIFELKRLINESHHLNFDYLSFQTHKKVPVIKTHLGFWAESISVKAIMKIKTKNKYYLEHVTNYFYENPQKFNVKFIDVDPLPENIRLTTDTYDDFLLNREIYESIKNINDQNIFTITKIISKRKDWLNKMQKQIILNKK